MTVYQQSKLNKQYKIFEHILREQVNFYETLFKSEGIDTIAAEYLVSKLETSLSEDHSRQLEENINKSELENALWSFKTNKSPGEDGLHIEWYRQFWFSHQA